MTETIATPGLDEPLVEYDEQGRRKMAHIIDCPEDKASAGSWAVEAMVLGLPLTALCGFVWVPTRDPKKYPVCQLCLDEAEHRVRDAYASR